MGLDGLDDRVLALARTSPDEERSVLCVHNVANDEVRLRLVYDRLRRAGGGVELLDEKRRVAARSGEIALDLRPYQVVWMAIE